MEMRAGDVILTVTCKWSGLFVHKGCYDTVLSQGRRTVRSHRFGERGSGVGGGAGFSGPSISLETKFASGQLQMSRLSSGHQKAVGWGLCPQELVLWAPGSLRMYDNGTMMQTSGQRFCGRQCQVGPGSPWKLAWQLLFLLWTILKLKNVIARVNMVMMVVKPMLMMIKVAIF